MHVIKFKALNTTQSSEVHEWLRENKTDPLKVRRQFSDVYRFAGLLQSDFPRLINLNNYPRRNRIALKVQNWTTFNFKVLSKHNMCLGKDLIEELSKGSPGAIEVVIYEMLRLRKKQQKEELSVQENEGEEEEVPTDEVPTEEVPTEEVPTEVIADEVLDEEYPAKNVPAEEYPAVEYPAVEYPAVEYPAEEYPAEEYPAEEQIQDEADAEVITEEPREAPPVEINHEDFNNIVQATSRMLLYSFYEDIYLEGQRNTAAEVTEYKEEIKAEEQTQDVPTAVVTPEETIEELVPVDIDTQDINNSVQATSRMILYSLYEDIYREGQDMNAVSKVWNDRMASLQSELQGNQDRLRQIAQVIATLPPEMQRLFMPIEDDE